MYLWLIPMAYVTASAIGGMILPRIEQAYLTSYTISISVASAQAYLATAASGTMAITGIVFAMAFVMVQFSAIAYSPRLVLWFARDRTLFHSLGAFSATFVYALFTLAWVDRGGSGSVPLFSTLLVAIMLVVSMLLFARLVQRLTDLQITSVLHLIGDRGRSVIQELFPEADDNLPTCVRQTGSAPFDAEPKAVTQKLQYSGTPRTITKFDIGALVRQAKQINGVIAMNCAVGDTLVHGSPVLHIYHGKGLASERLLSHAVHLGRERTLEQDPKYPIRVLVDIAIKALSPAINDPTTAVQTLDQIEDLLRRLGSRKLDTGYISDDNGKLRLIFPMPTWEDYLSLAFDEIRQYGTKSIQVIRRLRSVLIELIEALPNAGRAEAVRQYLTHLDLAVEHSDLDAEDRLMARQEDRQGLGLSRHRRSTEAQVTLVE